MPLLDLGSGHATALAQYALVFALGIALALRVKGAAKPGFWTALLGAAVSVLALLHPPSDDVFRYLWEGFLLASPQGPNPYSYPPAFFEGTELAGRFLYYDQINNPDKTAIYGGLFLLATKTLAQANALMGGDAESMLFLYRIAVALAGAGTALVLVRLVRLRQGDEHLWKAALFLLNPVWVFWALGELHLDVFWVGLLLTAFWLREQAKQKKGEGRAAAAKTLLMTACFWAAVHLKFPAVLFLPFFLGKWPWGLLNHLFVASLGVACFVVPFASDGLQSLWASSKTFATQMTYNASPIHDYVLRWLGDRHVLLWGTFGALYLWIVLTKASTIRSALWVWTFFLWFSPNVHPWYLALALALNVFVNAKSLWLWSLLIGASLVTVRNHALNGVWEELPGLAFWAYCVVFAAFVAEFFWTRFAPKLPKFEALERPTLSVIIPTWNEQRTLPACLSALRKAAAETPSEVEVVVADGGSTDETLGIARREGLKVVRSSLGRGGQLASAMKEAQGDVVIVLHSDVLLSSGALRRTVDAFQGNRRLAMLSHSMGFEEGKGNRGMNWVRRLNDLRARVASISFGDQVQAVRRLALEAIGGFPRRKLFEDVELALRMRVVGKVRHIASEGGKVSLRHWKKGGRLRRALFIIALCALYFVGRGLAWDPNGKTLYKLYYRGKGWTN